MKGKKSRLSLCGLSLCLAASCWFGPVALGQVALSPMDRPAVRNAVPPVAQSRSTNSGAGSNLVASGWQKLFGGDYPAALNDFNQALAADANNSAALAGRAMVSAHVRKFNEALADANLALATDPEEPRAHWAHGKIMYNINSYPEAVKDFRAVLSASPSFAPAHIALGESLLNLGERQNATASFRQAADLFKDEDPEMAKSLLSYAARFEQSSGGGSAKSRSLPLENLQKVYQKLPGNGDRAFFARNVKWPPGKVVKVAFDGGDEAIRKKIADSAVEWSKYANLSFDFKDHSGKYREWHASDKKYSADIRIGFDSRTGYWSVLGQQSISEVKPGEQSMNLDPTNWDVPSVGFGGTVMHEFGHALGFLHEHEHPHAACSTELRWLDDDGYQATFDNAGIYMVDSRGRRPGLLTYFAATQGWSPMKTYSQLASYEDSHDLVVAEVDTTSIMQYPMEAFLLRTGMASPCYAERNYVLSDGDKKMAASQYPKK